MDIYIKSNVFEIKIRFNKKLVLSAICLFAALLLLLFCSQSATATITICGLLICYCSAVIVLLFSGFSVSCESASPSKQEKPDKPAEEKTGRTRQVNRHTSHRTSPPIPKLDIPVPEYTEAEQILVPPQPSASTHINAAQDVVVVPDWKKLLSGKE